MGRKREQIVQRSGLLGNGFWIPAISWKALHHYILLPVSDFKNWSPTRWRWNDAFSWFTLLWLPMYYEDGNLTSASRWIEILILLPLTYDQKLGVSCVQGTKSQGRIWLDSFQFLQQSKTFGPGQAFVGDVALPFRFFTKSATFVRVIFSRCYFFRWQYRSLIKFITPTRGMSLYK